MSIYKFSLLNNNQHLNFDPTVDILKFDSSGITASNVELLQNEANLRFSFGNKKIFLDATSIGELSFGTGANVTFANNSVLVIGDGTANTLADYYGQDYSSLASKSVGNQVWGLGGADLVHTGSGADRLVGNIAMTPLNHVSRSGNTGSPTNSSSPSISADGKFVAFSGGWTLFGSTNNFGSDVLVKNMDSGAVGNENKSAAGVNGNSGSGSPVISADGKFMVFQGSSGLVPGSPPSGTLYVAGVASNQIEAVSKTSDGLAYADRAASNPDISGDGRYIVFSSTATNLAADSTSNYEDIFMKDRVTGEVTRLSTGTGGGDGNGDSQYAKISADGRFVVFQSFASNLSTFDGNGYADIFVWDRNDGSVTNITKDMPVDSNPNNSNYKPDVAFDDGYGGMIVFETAKNLVPEDTSNGTDIYAYNMSDETVQLVSSKADGSGVSLSSEDASVSGDGRFVVFTSYSDQLVPGDSNGTRDIFVKDLHTGEIALVSKSAAGLAANGPSSHAQISLGGDWIVFESSASNLANTDGNGTFSDVFRVSNPLLKDTLIGGAGNDTYVLNRADIVQEQLNGGIDTVLSSISYTLGENVENLTLTGSANLKGTGNKLNNLIIGNAGNNELNGGTGIDTVSYEDAKAGVTVNLQLTSAQSTGGAGTDKINKFENLIGSDFADILTGDISNNRIDGGLGKDRLEGGTGDDSYIVDANTDVIIEAVAAGTDTVFSSVTWTLGATLENLTLTGSAAINGGGNSTANVLIGNAADNTLTGGSDNDTVKGGGGDDTIIGGAGNDQLTGGTGTDAFVFNNTNGKDTITDFVSGTDDLHIDQSVFGIGDGDLIVEGALTRPAPGGFSSSAELVIFTTNLASLSANAAATAIGNANSAYSVGDKALFAVDNGTNSQIYLFSSADTNAQVSPGELTLLGTLNGTASTVVGDYLFVA